MPLISGFYCSKAIAKIMFGNFLKIYVKMPFKFVPVILTWLNYILVDIRLVKFILNIFVSFSKTAPFKSNEVLKFLFKGNFFSVNLPK